MSKISITFTDADLRKMLAAAAKEMIGSSKDVPEIQFYSYTNGAGFTVVDAILCFDKGS